MRPIYNPIHTSSRPKTKAQSNKQPPAAPDSPAENKSVVQSHSEAPPAFSAGTPALGQKGQTKVKPLVFCDVNDAELINLIKNEEAFSRAMQNGSIFGMRSPNANALAAACYHGKFDLAIQLLEHPLAEEAFLEDTAGIANILARLDLMSNYNKSKLKSFLKTMMQGLNIQKIEEYLSEKKYNSAILILAGLSKFFTYHNDSESLKKLLFSLKESHYLKCCEASLELFHGRIHDGNILSSLECILEAGIQPSKEWCRSVLLTRMRSCSPDHLEIFNLLTACNDKNLISKEDTIERDILIQIHKKTQERTLSDCALNLLNYTHKRKINILEKEENKKIIHQAFFSITIECGYHEEDIPLKLKEKTEKIFESIELSDAKDIFNAEWIDHFFTKIPWVASDWTPLQAEYANWIFDRIISILGEEHFMNCIETSSVLRKVLEYFDPKPLKIKSLIQRGANPMVPIDETMPDSLLNLNSSMDTQRCLAQSQHHDYKTFILSTLFGLKSARLPGGNYGSSIPIIEKGFEAFLKAFPSALDSAVIDRIQKAYTQAMSFDNRQDLLKHFAESATEPDTIQLAYLGADNHVYAYVMYQDMLIETQRSEETYVLTKDTCKLFYITNATSFDLKKVRAIQMLPIDKAEAQNLLQESNTEQSHSIKDYHLRFGKSTLDFCQKQSRLIEDLGPLLEYLGLDTSFSILTDPAQQKKVALGQIFQGLGYLAKDGSGAVLDAFKDKNSSELAYALKKSTNLDPEAFISWLEDPSLSKVEFLKKVLDALGITKKELYYVSDADRKDPLAAIAFEKTPQKTGNCYFASPMLNFGTLMWWATVLERAKEQGITVTREHVGQNPEFYKAIYKEVEPTYKELVRFMKLSTWEDYQQRFGKLSNPEIQAEIEAKVAKLKSPSYLAASEEDL